MLIQDGIIKKGDLVDVFAYKSPGNNTPEGTGWMKKVDKWINGSTKMSVKFYVDGLIYHNIPLKNVTKVEILNTMYSDIWKIENVVTISKRNRQRRKYTDNNAHASIDPNVQNMSKIQVLRMILHEGAQKNPRESCWVSEKNYQFYFDQGYSKKNG